MKYFVEGRWWTELGRQIRMNDLIREIRQCLRSLDILQKNPPGKKSTRKP